LEAKSERPVIFFDVESFQTIDFADAERHDIANGAGSSLSVELSEINVNVPWSQLFI
jgi:hypothetical protein